MQAEPDVRPEQRSVGGQRPQGFFRLSEEGGVVFDVAVEQRVVDVGHPRSGFGQPVTEEHVFVAIVAQGFVEWCRQENAAPYHEVERTECRIRGSVAPCGRVAAFGVALVVVAQADSGRRLLVGMDDAAADHVGISVHGFSVAREEMRVGWQAVAVKKEHPFAPRFAPQQVADGRPSQVVRWAQAANDRPVFQTPAGLCHLVVGRCVVADKDFHTNRQVLCLPVQRAHQEGAVVVERRNEHR